MSKAFIFGYGSLICLDSRSRTGVSTSAVPVTVSDVKRGWYIRNSDYFYASVAIIRSPGSLCRGVLFEIPFSEITRFDQREYKYQRIQLSPESIAECEFTLSPTDVIYTYCISQIEQPDYAHPIPLSYLEVIMHGCLSYGEAFAHEFIETTGGWNAPWINDIELPVYVRPLAAAVDRTKLPALYSETLAAENEINRLDYLKARAAPA